MNAKKILLGFVAIVGLVACGAAIAHWAGAGPQRDASADGPGTEEITGPQPKLVVEEPTYDFGVMSAGVEKKHSFVVRNDGEATLQISKVKLSCQCTKAAPATSDVAPGESTTIDVSWQPEKKDPNFQQTLKVVSNDPRYPVDHEFKLIVKGAVESLVTIEPAMEFDVGAIPEDQPTVVHGRIYSKFLDSFNIQGVSTENPLLTGAAKPMNAELLKEMNAKCGYDVELTLAPGIQVGPFTQKVTVKTDIDGETTIPWFIKGRRFGPFRILPILGAQWSQEKMSLSLGRFPATKGAKAQMKMLVTGLPPEQEMQFIDVESGVGFLKCALEPDGDNTSLETKKYELTFEVPPGNPPMTRVGPEAAKVRVKTNHPKAEMIEFTVSFVAL